VTKVRDELELSTKMQLNTSEGFWSAKNEFQLGVINVIGLTI